MTATKKTPAKKTTKKTAAKKAIPMTPAAKAEAEAKAAAEPAKAERTRATTGDAFKLLDASRDGADAIEAALLELPLACRNGAVKKAIARTSHKDTHEALKVALAKVPTGTAATGKSRGSAGTYRVHRHTKASTRKLVSLPIPEEFPVELGGSLVRVVVLDDGDPRIELRPAPVATDEAAAA